MNLKSGNALLLLITLTMIACGDGPDLPITKIGAAESKFNIEVINKQNRSYTIYFFELRDETMGLPSDSTQCSFTSRSIRRSSTLLFENLNPDYTYRVIAVRDTSLVLKVDTTQNIRFPIISVFVEEELSNLTFRGTDTLNCTSVDF